MRTQAIAELTGRLAVRLGGRRPALVDLSAVPLTSRGRRFSWARRLGHRRRWRFLRSLDAGVELLAPLPLALGFDEVVLEETLEHLDQPLGLLLGRVQDFAGVLVLSLVAPRLPTWRT